MPNNLKVLNIDEVCTVCGKHVDQCMAYAYDNLVVHQWRVCRECLQEAVDKMSADS
jgi:hypothetical protein